MKWRIALWLVLVFVTSGVLYCAQSLVLQRTLAEKTVRLHVVANSDTADDQAQKLTVRDAVLQEVNRLTAACESAEDARQTLGAHLKDIELAARQVCDREIAVSLGMEDFETRYYDTFTLPAGRYPALRVRIGAAEGKNWWCVVFPSLCLCATSEDTRDAALTGGFSPEETELITGGETQYRLRFKTLQWLKELGSWVSGKN